MIEAKISNGICETKIDGNVAKLKEDTLSFVRCVHEAMLDSRVEVKDAEKKAEEYKKFVCEELASHWDDARKVTNPEEALECLLKAFINTIEGEK